MRQSWGFHVRTFICILTLRLCPGESSEKNSDTVRVESFNSRDWQAGVQLRGHKVRWNKNVSEDCLPDAVQLWYRKASGHGDLRAVNNSVGQSEHKAQHNQQSNKDNERTHELG